MLQRAEEKVKEEEYQRVAEARGPQLCIFVDVILESLDSWLNSEIPESIFVDSCLPNKGLWIA